MSCLKFNKNIAVACRNATPGVAEVYIANYEDVTAVAYNAGLTQITSITGATASGATSGSFYTLVVNRESSGFVDNTDISVPDGRASFIPTMTLKISGMDSDTREIFKQLAQARVTAIFKTTSGEYFIAGVNNGLDMSAGTFATGVARGDFKGLEVTLEGVEAEPIISVAAGIIPALLVA